MAKVRTLFKEEVEALLPVLHETYRQSPELVFGLDRVAAIVTDIGGRLCHAAIVARERGVPCVVGTGDATAKLRSRMLVTVDGDAGVGRRAR